jgi:transcription antitermination factor NusG
MSGAIAHRKADDNRRSIHESEARWFAIRTPYKREKSTLKELKLNQIECYLPVVPVVKKYNRSIKTYELPLINNYVFVKIRRSEYITVLGLRDVLGFLKFEGALIAIPEEEISLLRRIVGMNENLSMVERKPRIGRTVEIIAGKLTGVKGVVADVLGKKTILVDLETLGWTLQIEVHPKYLRTVR